MKRAQLATKNIVNDLSVTPISFMNPNSTYRPDIDGLRAVAVLAVVLHYLSASFVPRSCLL